MHKYAPAFIIMFISLYNLKVNQKNNYFSKKNYKPVLIIRYIYIFYKYRSNPWVTYAFHKQTHSKKLLI